MRFMPSFRSIAAAALSLAVLVPVAEAAKPGAVALSVPDGAITGPMPALTWNRLQGAVTYQIQGYDKKGDKILSMTVTPTDANCTSRPFCRVLPAMPFPSGPNKWRIRAKNADGSGPWSDYADFWVGGPAISQSTVASSGAFTVVSGAQTVLSIEFDVPGPGAVSVSSHGYLRCTRANATGTVDVSTVVTDNPDDAATGASRPGFIALNQPMAVGQRVNLNQGTTRVFEVAEGGLHTYYWRTNGFTFNPANDVCLIFSGTLTAEYLPYYIAPTPPTTGASAGRGGADGSSAAPR